MKIGVKTFGSEKFFKFFEDKADFFEVMATQKNDYSFLKKFSLPFVIHAEHQIFGINPADISKKEQNLKSVNFAVKIADITNSKKIIVHPGVVEKGNPNCSEKNAIDFFNKINDDRILIENLFQKKNPLKGINLCSTSKELEIFLKKTGFEFCFDINHAIANQKKFNGDYGFINKFIKLNPKHYHFGGQKISEGKEHLCFEDSDINIKEILKYPKKNAEITLETEIDIKKVEKDVEIVRGILEP